MVSLQKAIISATFGHSGLVGNGIRKNLSLGVTAARK
jgi:hypothetical protein